MGKYVRYRNGHESFTSLPGLLMEWGESTAPRGQETFEIRDLLIEIDNPHDVVPPVERKWNPRIAVAEFLQLVGGFSDPAKMVEIAPNFERFTDGGAFHGAYGPRLSPQLRMIAERLTMDPSTRQAVSVIWDPLHDLMQEGKKDYPCTVDFVFAVRKGKLLMTTHMRSNDFWWGWTYDLFQFTQLQCTMANFLGHEVGSYTHFANSFHAYQRNMDDVMKLEDAAERETPYAFNGLGNLGIIRWSSVQSRAQGLFYGDRSYAWTDGERQMRSWLHD